MTVVAPRGEEEPASAVGCTFFCCERNVCTGDVETTAEAIPVARARSYVEIPLEARVRDNATLLGIRRIRFIAPDHRRHVFRQLRHQIGALQNNVGPELRLMLMLLGQRKQAIQEFQIQQVFAFMIDALLAAALPKLPRFIAADV